MRKGFLITQKEASTVDNGRTTRGTRPSPALNENVSFSSSSWKRGFLNSEKKKSHYGAGKMTRNKSLPQCLHNKNNTTVEKVGAKKTMQSNLPSSKKLSKPIERVVSGHTETLLPTRSEEQKYEPKKRKQTSSALLFMEETELTNRSGVLSIVNAEEIGENIGNNPSIGSNLVMGTKGIVLPLHERDGNDGKEEVLLREIETKTRCRNIVGQNFEDDLKRKPATSLSLCNTDHKRLPLQVEETVSSDLFPNSLKIVLEDTPDPVGLRDNSNENIDANCSIRDHGDEQIVDYKLGRTKVTTSIKMELSLVLSRLKKEFKHNRASSHRANYAKKTDTKLASKKMLLSFIQKHLQSEISTHSVSNNLNLVWESILESIALHAKDNLSLPNETWKQGEDAYVFLPPAICLGLSILQNCPREGWLTLYNVSLDNENRSGNEVSVEGGEDMAYDKKKGLQALGAALLIKLRLHSLLNFLSTAISENGKEIVSGKEISDHEAFLLSTPCILQNVLPALIGIIDKRNGGRKRTLLSTTCMDSILLIIEFTAHIYKSGLCGIFKSPIFDTMHMLLFGTLPLIKKVLDIMKQWVTNEALMPHRESNKSNDKYEDNIVKYIDATRKQCALATLNDWNRVLSYTEESYRQCRFTDMQDEQMSQMAAVSSLCHELIGVKITKDQNKNLSAPLNIGGFACTLCKGIPEFRNVSVETLLEALDASCYFVKSRLDRDSPTDAYYNEETIILRAVCSWFARKKYFQWVTSHSRDFSDRDSKPSTQNKSSKAVQLCMATLRSRSGRCSDLVLVILNRLWSESSGLPADMHNITKSQLKIAGPPGSFVNLLQNFDLCQIEKDKDSTILSPPQKVICGLIERFILHKSEILLPYFLSRKQTSTMSVHVLISILGKIAVENANHSSTLSRNLSLQVIEKLLDLIDSNKYFQKTIQECPDIFSSFATDVTVPRLMKIIGLHIKSTYTISLVSAALGSILLKCPECHLYNAIDAIIKEAELLDSKVKDQNCNRSFPLVKCASTWRRTILQDQPHGPKRFTKLLTTIGNAMFRMPSNSYPLSLFGAFIGDGANICDEPPTLQEKIAMRDTTRAILELALPKINEQLDDHAEKLFLRLSPLLILRRIPYAYFQLLQINDGSDSALLTQLAKAIALKLGIETLSTIHVVKTREEKRLLAEIAARCLPFSGLKIHESLRRTKLSCFERLCKPVFLNTLNTLHQNTVTKSDLEQAKFSLYTVCHFVQISKDDDFADGLTATIAFALQIISLQSICEGDNCYDQIIQLQTGCIDFFATCLQSSCNRVAINGNRRLQRRFMIQEINPISTQLIKAKSSLQKSAPEKMVKTCLESIFPLLLEIICIADVEKTSMNIQWLDLKALIGNSNKYVHFSFTARTCLLNSFSLAAQRCSIDDGSLELLSSLGIPSILQFAVGGRTDDKLRHKLCIAASLQFIFNVLTRTKSFHCVKTQSLTIADSVRQIYMFCANIVQTHSDDADTQASGLLRSASLKLLLAITSVDQCGDDRTCNTSIKVRDCLAPGELAQLFSTLRGAAIDSDKGVQALASHILNTIKSSI